MQHKERIQIVKNLTNKVIQKYRDEIILGGIYGSMVTGLDTEYSDIDLLFIVNNNSKARSINFRYKDIVINLHIQKIKDIKKDIENLDLAWPFKMGGVFYIKIIYGDKSFLKKLEGKAKNISGAKINKFIKKFNREYIYSVFEAFDKLKSLKIRKEYHEKKILVFDMLILMVLFIAILNRRFLEGNYHYILDNIGKFRKLPQDFQKLSLKIVKSENLDEIIHLAKKLMNNFLVFLKNNGGKFKETKSLEKVKL